MTRYILAGGNDLMIDSFGSNLAREVYETIERPANILSCFFATPSEFWGVKAKTWRQWIERYFGENVMWAYAAPETFIEQMKDVDVVYLHGGDNDLMFEMLDHYSQLSAHFGDKEVVASSAGANYLSSQYWARRKQRVLRGKGIIPYAVIVHFESTEDGVPESDWNGVVRLFESTQSETITLREGQYRVIEQ